jgi:hypothetical protein
MGFHGRQWLTGSKTVIAPFFAEDLIYQAQFTACGWGMAPISVVKHLGRMLCF